MNRRRWQSSLESYLAHTQSPAELLVVMNAAFAALGISELIDDGPAKAKQQVQKAPLSAKEQRALDAKKKEDKLRKKAAIIAAGGTLPVKEKKEKASKKNQAVDDEQKTIAQKAIAAAEKAEREENMTAEEKEEKLAKWRADRAAVEAEEERIAQQHVAHCLGIKATYLDAKDPQPADPQPADPQSAN